MTLHLKEYCTKSGELILYNGTPDFSILENLVAGPGDVWHSSFEQGYKNAFPELVYQTSVFWWYINDFDNLDQCVSWRINPNQFAIRKEIWEKTNGFDTDFDSLQMQALDYGFNGLWFLGIVPLYVENLFKSEKKEEIFISRKDRYTFYAKNFKQTHSIYMIYRKGFWKISEWKTFLGTRKRIKQRTNLPIVNSRILKQIDGNPKVSYIIPTMFRQDYTLQLLDDLSNQDYPLAEVIIVDATPQNDRDESLYQKKQYPFKLKVVWQQSRGSCRARNEAIELCTGDYIVFGDDDIRVQSNFIGNHIRFLQTYKADACNGLDIRADHHQQNLEDLENKLQNFGSKRWKAGVTSNFSNANSCVKREYVNQLVGNDVNFDGGYGEDSDFGLSLAKIGVTVLFNPHACNLHLKPPSGGYRWWGVQSKILGKKRKQQPWELDTPVKSIRPVPSPTVMYGILKQFTPQQLIEYKHKHFFYYLFTGSKFHFLYRLIRLPYKNLQFKKSIFYAKKLINIGIRYK
jgi:glycosyltransferase involved in cell wall biosynthesis